MEYGQGQSAYDLEAFDKGAEMAEMRGKMFTTANQGLEYILIAYDDVGDGSTRHGLMAATLFRMHGFTVTFEESGLRIEW
ncbi:hypothetical protein [Planomicrobium sp. YIM 101495]|uniref:hypothetical protein n=1 Tax=Planomicrobium sp. YIM 101495 TaxID=2665160 RepID=UPI0012B9AD3F|nr:hypothetical protein [Planomicrobium sp. YIM 101495]MTD30187.1 hypothetical protein [Planomicrobium sp. YIM 101495]